MKTDRISLSFHPAVKRIVSEFRPSGGNLPLQKGAGLIECLCGVRPIKRKGGALVAGGVTLLHFNRKVSDISIFHLKGGFSCADKMLSCAGFGGGAKGSHWLFLALACVRMWDLRLVDWANFLLQPSKGQT